MLALNWLSPHDLIETLGTIGLFVVIFVESGLLPAPLPGDSLLFLAGIFAANKASGSNPHLNLGVVLIGAFVCAVIGAQIGYWIGHRFGTRLFKPDARVFKTEYLERAQAFFDRSGVRAVVIGRFIPFVRTIVPILAGTSRMPQRAFATANVAGAALWAVGVTLLGFFLGDAIGADNVDRYLLPIVAVIVVLSLIPPFLEYRRHRRERAAIAKAE
ncbi:MAG TPA: DedA family protein [Acidimicrobiia bacterium]|nr:DedA family protein [Acidimicrobiia bacterium]